MRNETAKSIGDELKPILDRLKLLAKTERDRGRPDAEALEIAVVNIDAAIEILTE